MTDTRYPETCDRNDTTSQQPLTQENPKMTNCALQLFPSQPPVTGEPTNTSFSTTPTEITEAIAEAFFRHDHTPIRFKGGHCKGDNFEYATCVVFDIDNGHSDAPADWVTPKDIARRLKKLGINYWMVASRNHKLSKDGKTPRPKFHVYLSLSAHLLDSDKFVLLCEWCIKTFAADPKVKSKAQKIFGYGDNPNASVKSWNGGRYIDEVLTDDDLSAVMPDIPERKQRTPITPSNSPPKESNTAFDTFVDSGEWRNHLADLEALGWSFFDKDDATYFQTPDGNHSPSKQDGNIKDGVAYIFSRAPTPFENDKGYSICQLFAGVLFGDIGKEGLAKFAERYLSAATRPGIVLNPSEPLPSADKFVEAIYSFHDIPTLIHYAGDYWQWIGNVYRAIETGEVKSRLLHFLEKAFVEYWNEDTPVYEPFPIVPSKLKAIEEMLKMRIFQSANDAVPCWIGGESCEMSSSVADPSLLIFGKHTILNLENMETLSPSPYWFNTAALDFDHDTNAECPLWLAFLDSIFEDDKESKQTLMEWMGLCLTPITKFQKALFLVGKRRSGKGTISRILQKIVGSHNSVSPSVPDFGHDFGLAPFIGKTLAVIADARFKGGFSPRLTERVLNITGEDMVSINRKNKEYVHIRLMTKLMFMSNEVPNILDQSGALPSRFIFLKLPKSFLGREDIELENKLSRELPGILRLAVQHLQNLLDRGYFIQPETGIASAKRMAALSSPVGEFIHKLRPYMTKAEIWENWKKFCDAEGQKHYGSKNVLWNNLDAAGYTCDFDTADILAKIRESDGRKAKVRDVQQSIGKYRGEGGADVLDRKLREMVKAGLLVIRRETAGNSRDIEWFCIPTNTAAK